MLTLCIGTTFAQRTVSGTVTDTDGLPLIGANVLIMGTSIGTITDIDGTYSLDVPDGYNTLVFSYTGFSTEEVDIAGRTTIDLVMAEGELLEEIVVTAGGLEKNKARLGYAIQNVEPDDVVAAKEVNLVNALNSKIAGVQVVSSSGSPGSSANIRIRGSKSINGTNDPLFVVDGVPIDNSSVGNGVDGVDQSNRAIDINPNDIASLTVLKGPAATALYGVRAANGAIIITTKKGEAGKPKISITASYAMDQVNKLPEMQSTYAQGRVLSGVPTYLGPSTGNGFSWGPLLSDLEFDGVPTEFDQNGSLVAAGTGNGVPARAYDQFDYFINGNTYDLNASVSGGIDATNYFVSAGRLTSNGIVPNSTFSRNSFRLNTNTDLSDKLSIGVSAAYSNSGGNRIQRGSNLNGVMLGLLRTTPTFDNGNGLVGQAAADNVSSYVLENGDMRSYRNGIYDNPYWTANRNPSQDEVDRIIGSIFAQYDVMDNLSLNYRLGVDTYTDKRNSAIDIQTNAFRPEPGFISQTKITNKDINSDLFLNYERDLTDDINMNLIVGYNIWDHHYNRQTTDGTTMSIPGFYHISNATDLVATEVIDRRRIHGLYATADLSYSDFLFLNLTARRDQSSTLPIDNNSYESYSASMGLTFTELVEIDRNIIDYGKLRASYGKVGNDALAYRTQSVFVQSESGGDGFITTVQFPNFGTNSFERSNLLANSLLTPESTTTFEIGADLKFLKGRLGLDFTYYNSKSEDVIIDVDVSAVTGFTNATLNSAVINNEGIEIVASATPVSNRNFNWDIDVNYTKYENIVESLAPGLEDIGMAGFVSTSADVVPGQPFSVIYGNGFQRNDNGDMIIGSDGWPLQDPIKKPMGDPNPDWTAGVRNTFSYKDFTLSALLDIRQGGEMWCGTCGIINYFGTSQLSADERNDVVVFDGVVDNGDGTFSPNNTPVALAEADPTASFSSFYRVRYGFGGISEMNIFDTSWLRLRELTLGYTLPQIESLGFLRGASIFLTGRNLWLNTDYPGIDPETNLTGDSNGFGLDYFNMPNTKSYTVTVRLDF